MQRNGLGSQCHHVKPGFKLNIHINYPSLLFLFFLVFSVDNSEWTRNGDYSPSRLEAAKETSNFMASRKLIDNVENCVGVMTMGGLKYYL